jgi:hypothetical protein
MKTRAVNIYTFAELSPKAKERAKIDFGAHNGYCFAEDAFASLKALAEHFEGKLKGYSVDFFNTSHSTASFDMPEMDRDTIAAKLAELGTYNAETLRGNGDCVLTGYCADEDAIDGFRIAFKGGESDLGKLMQAGFETWLKAAQSDAEAQYTDENFGEFADANGYEYFEDGSMA